MSFEIIYKLLKIISEENIYTYRLTTTFSSQEINFLKLLYEEGYIQNKMNEETYIEKIVLTKRGEMSIFAVEHKEELNTFKEALSSLKHDTSYIFDYLLASDLKSDYIFSPYNYVSFLQDTEKNTKIKKHVK